MGSTVKGKNLLCRSKFFPLRVGPLLIKKAETFLTSASLASVSTPLMATLLKSKSGSFKVENFPK